MGLTGHIPLKSSFPAIEDLYRDVDKHIGFFNNMRPHQKLERLTPSEAERNFANKRAFRNFQVKESKILLQYHFNNNNCDVKDLLP